MADSAVAVTAGSGTNIDTRTEGTNGNHRAVVVVGDPATNAGVAPVDATAGLKVDLGSDNDVALNAGTNFIGLASVFGSVNISGGSTWVTWNSNASVNVSNFPATQAVTQSGSWDIRSLLSTASLHANVGGTVAATQSGSWNVGLTGLVSLASGTNVSLNAGTNFIGLASVQGNVAVSNTVTADVTGQGDVPITLDGETVGLSAGANYIGLATVNVGSAIPAGANYVGLASVNIGGALPALSAGTAAIGKILPPDIDVTAHTNYAKKYYTSTGAATDGIIWSPAAGKRWHVVSMYIQTSAAATITLEDDKAGGDEAIWKGEFTDNQGMTINFGEKYPLASGEDAADLTVTTTAGNIYITVTGYEV